MHVSHKGLALLAAGIAGCSGASGDIESDGGGGSGRPPTPVEVVVAFSDTVVDAILSTGQVEAIQSIELRPEVEGRLVEILVREGAEVRQGTPLYKVDDAELRAEVARLEAERDLAAQALRRTRDLLERNASSEADLERAEAAARSTQAQLDLAQLRLERTTVRAPFSGVVGRRRVSVGDYVTTSTTLTTLQTVDPQWATFSVPERYAGELEEGQRVTFSVASTRKQYTGTVDFVSPSVQLPSRTIEVKARARNPDRELRPGMFVEVRLATDIRPNATVVPEDAILPLEGSDYVWVVAEGSASRREVELGVRFPGFVEIVSGVETGEQVVVGGLERLFEGAPVAAQVVERRPSDSGTER